MFVLNLDGKEEEKEKDEEQGEDCGSEVGLWRSRGKWRCGGQAGREDGVYGDALFVTAILKPPLVHTAVRLLAEINVALWELRPLEYLEPTLVGPVGTAGPEPGYRYQLAWHPGVDNIGCGASGVPPLAAWLRWVRPSGSDRLAWDSVASSVARVPSQTSAQAGLTAAPLQPAFMCPFNEQTAGSAACYKTQSN
ncbi:unnamed protein product [Pleuronectes platessa]|uniref:Uncharacterized protein n=1 Tax=Pleuronectes platessa TaxID=8262 RepID=A0A9N7TRI8_PLEPL|nr:unnamed protein product [Pleuronectes platessa]